MFSRRRAAYHPYRPSTPKSAPAGTRIADHIKPKQCFGLFPIPDFFNMRSPDPSPLNSPVRDPNDSDENSPPAMCLADLFAGIIGATPQRPATAAAPVPPVAESPMRFPPRRNKNKYGPKHLSFGCGAVRSGIFPPHRHAKQSKEKRQTARKEFVDSQKRRVVVPDDFPSLTKEAEQLMRPEHMNDEDKIFFEQLANLQLDLKLNHDLEQCRQRVVRAAAESSQRQWKHRQEDVKAARIRSSRTEGEALEVQQRMAAEFVRAIDDEKEEQLRCNEEAAMRAEEERRRAHEVHERQVREDQERVFRDELVRKAKEEERHREQERRRQEEEEGQRQKETERQRREETKRKLREEREQRRIKMEQQLREAEARRVQEERLRRFREEHEQLMREHRERQAREEFERRERDERERRERELRERRERAERERQERAEREHLEWLERERRKRVERERLEREEGGRQARFLAEQARLAAEKEAQVIHQHFALYEGKWNELRTSNVLSNIDAQEMPWPVFGTVSSLDVINYDTVRAFLFHPQRPGVEGKSARDKVKSEVLRFHPDKFNTRILPKIRPDHQATAQAIAGAVARILTRLMTEEDQKM